MDAEGIAVEVDRPIVDLVLAKGATVPSAGLPHSRRPCGKVDVVAVDVGHAEGQRPKTRLGHVKGAVEKLNASSRSPAPIRSILTP
jgi:hypothetical protein